MDYFFRERRRCNRKTGKHYRRAEIIFYRVAVFFIIHESYVESGIEHRGARRNCNRCARQSDIRHYQKQKNAHEN